MQTNRMKMNYCLPNHSIRFLLVLILLLPGGSACALNTNQVLDAWVKAQAGFHTWSADFEQTRFLKALTQPLSTSGKLWFAMPNRFRWELGVPPQTIVLRRPDELLVVYPRLKRMERYSLEGKAASTWRDVISLLEAGFPQTRKDLEGQFHILSLQQTNTVYEIRMQPRNALARRLMAEIKVALQTNGFMLATTELEFSDGSRLKNDFSNGRFNLPLDDTLFDFKPGADFKIVAPLNPSTHD
jgi:outer membrane lipoprotein-sorting protein